MCFPFRFTVKMQSLLRTICRTESRGTSSKLVNLTSPGVAQLAANYGVHQSLFGFTLDGKQTDTSKRFLLPSGECSKDQSVSIKSLRAHSWICPTANSTFSCNGFSSFGFGGKTAYIRYLSTMENAEVSSEQETSSSPAVEHPSRIKFKRLDKTARHIMNILDKEQVEKVRTEREIPDVQPGCIVQMKVQVPENKRRETTLKGIVIARRNAGINTTFRLRGLVDRVGVESVFHLYSPNIKEIKIVDRRKVRRAKLYYLRDRMNPLKK